LADVAVVLHDLSDREACIQQLASVKRGACTELIRRRVHIRAQASGEVIEKSDTP
jgi:hypothetical protein